MSAAPPRTLQGIDARPLAVRTVPALAVAAAGLAVLLLRPALLGRTLALVGAYLVTPLGQEAWLVAASATFGLPVRYAAGVLLWVSAVQALVFSLAVHVEDLVARLPRLGARVRRLEERIRSSPRAQRSVALVLFLAVLTPLHPGGAIVASLAGRLLGLSAGLTLAAVLGAITVRFVVAVALIEGAIALAH